jgi:hypothetical protein
MTEVEMIDAVNQSVDLSNGNTPGLAVFNAPLQELELETQQESQEDSESGSDDGTSSRLKLADKLREANASPSVFRSAFAKLRTKLGKEKELEELVINDQAFEKAASEILEILKADKLSLYQEIGKFFKLTDLSPDEFELKVKDYFSALKSGEITRRTRGKQVPQVSDVSSLKAQIAHLTPEDLVAIADEINARRAELNGER